MVDTIAAECSTPVHTLGRQYRLFVKDQNCGKYFLVDSGADLSVIPVAKSQKGQPSDFNLYAANGSQIKTYG